MVCQVFQGKRDSGLTFWGEKKHPFEQGRIYRGTTQIDQGHKNKKRYRTGANCRGTTLLRTHDPLKSHNAGKRRGLLSVQPAVQEGTSSCTINRLTPSAGSLDESARLLSSIITFVIYNYKQNYG